MPPLNENQTPKQAVLVASTNNLNPNQIPEKLALFTNAGVGVAPVTKQAAQADTVAADLAALKVDFNALLAKLRLAGILA